MHMWRGTTKLYLLASSSRGSTLACRTAAGPLMYKAGVKLGSVVTVVAGHKLVPLSSPCLSKCSHRIHRSDVSQMYTHPCMGKCATINQHECIQLLQTEDIEDSWTGMHGVLTSGMHAWGHASHQSVWH